MIFLIFVDNTINEIMSNNVNASINRLDIIDYFKGIAIIIIICHIAQVFDVPPIVYAITSFGRMGCQIFFVLSGFTITMSYEKSHPNLRSFYKKRWLSLAPGYWLSILITVLLSIVTIEISGINQLGTSLRIGDIIANFLLLNGVVPTDANNMVFRGGWFVGTLTIFYLLYPILHQGYKKYGNYFLFGCIFVSMSISIISFSLTDNIYSGCSGFLYYNFMNQLSPFLLGVVMYKNTIQKKHSLIKSLFFLGISMFLFYTPFPFKAVFVPLVFSLSIVYLLNFLWENRLSYNQIVCNLGKLSYPIFLLHIFIIWDIPKLILSSIISLNSITCMIWGIFSLIFVYYAGIVYNKFINLFTNCIMMRL